MLQQSYVSRYFGNNMSRLGSMSMACRKWLPAALVAGVCLGSASLARHADAATITPNAPTAVAGSSFTLTLFDTIDPGSGIGAIDLQITFDSKLLSLTSVMDGALLTDAGWDPAYFGPTGGVSISEDAYTGNDPEGTGSIILATFSVLASAPTVSTEISFQSTSDANKSPYEYHLTPISEMIGITAASTPPTTVPEPGTVVLLLAPMLAAASLKRRERC